MSCLLSIIFSLCIILKNTDGIEQANPKIEKFSYLAIWRCLVGGKIQFLNQLNFFKQVLVLFRVMLHWIQNRRIDLSSGFWILIVIVITCGSILCMVLV